MHTAPRASCEGLSSRPLASNRWEPLCPHNAFPGAHQRSPRTALLRFCLGSPAVHLQSPGPGRSLTLTSQVRRLRAFSSLSSSTSRVNIPPWGCSVQPQGCRGAVGRAGHWQLLATVSQDSLCPKPKFRTKWTWRSKPVQFPPEPRPAVGLARQTTASLSDEHKLGTVPAAHPVSSTHPGFAAQSTQTPKRCCPPDAHWEQTREPDRRRPLDHHWSHRQSILLLRSLQTPEAFTTCCPTSLQTLSHSAPGRSRGEPQRGEHQPSGCPVLPALHTRRAWGLPGPAGKTSYPPFGR